MVSLIVREVDDGVYLVRSYYYDRAVQEETIARAEIYRRYHAGEPFAGVCDDELMLFPSAEDYVEFVMLKLQLLGQSHYKLTYHANPDIDKFPHFALHVMTGGSVDAEYAPNGVLSDFPLCNVLNFVNAWRFETKGLQKVIIPNGVDKIDGTISEAFHNACEVALPDTVAEMPALIHLQHLTEIHIPHSMTEIPMDFCKDCGSLQKIEWHDNIQSIGLSAFCGCKELQRAELPCQLQELGSSAFSGCTSLSEVVLPKTLQKIGMDAFVWCTSLTEIDLSACERVEIGGRAFANSGLVTLTIPDSVVKVAENAFRDCKALRHVDIQSAGFIQSCCDDNLSVFNNCDSLESVVFADTLTCVPNALFMGCSALSEVSLPDSLENIYGYAFHKCTSLRSMDFPNGVHLIGGSAFRESGIERLELQSDALQAIGSMAFSRCAALTDVRVVGKQGVIYGSAFEDCTFLQSVHIENIQQIYGTAFRGCINLKQVTLVGVEHIGGRCFRDCRSLEEITFADTVAVIESYCFEGCTNLRRVHLPDSLQEIGAFIFDSCQRLEHINIPDGFRNVSGLLNTGVFPELTVTISREHPQRGYVEKLLERQRIADIEYV